MIKKNSILQYNIILIWFDGFSDDRDYPVISVCVSGYSTYTAWYYYYYYNNHII